MMNGGRCAVSEKKGRKLKKEGGVRYFYGKRSVKLHGLGQMERARDDVT